MTQQFGDVTVDVGDDYVAEVEIHRPPGQLLRRQADPESGRGLRHLDADPACRAIVLCSEGKHFCAGADFNAESDAEALPEEGAASLYREAVRLFRAQTPVVAAVQGAAIGGGLGLACSADFRVARAGGPLRRQLRPARLPPRLRPHRHPAVDRRSPAGAGAALHGPAHPWRGGPRIGLVRPAGAAGGGPRTAARAWPRRSPRPGRWRSAPSARPCAATWPTRWRRPPTARTPSRSACADRRLRRRDPGQAERRHPFTGR